MPTQNTAAQPNEIIANAMAEWIRTPIKIPAMIFGIGPTGSKIPIFFEVFAKIYRTLTGWLGRPPPGKTGQR